MYLDKQKLLDWLKEEKEYFDEKYEEWKSTGSRNAIGFKASAEAYELTAEVIRMGRFDKGDDE